VIRMKNKLKTPSITKFPSAIKKSRKENAFNGFYPVWQFSSMDFEGPFGWHPSQKIATSILLEIRTKLAQFESMTWHEIEGRRHHFQPVDSICKEAQQRLAELKQDDLDGLFSLSLSGPQRVWGIRSGAVFKILWWDPDHQVYPCKLKHT
jgi:hypothetical protein